MNKLIATFLLLYVFLPSLVLAQTNNLLTEEEHLWLAGRNNTVVVYPEKNSPPFSYQSHAGNIQGLSIDYIELIARKAGFKVEYLLPQSRGLILADFTRGKGDVVTGITESESVSMPIIFTDHYVSVPNVIVARKDYSVDNSNLTMNDFNGKKVAVVAGSQLEGYIRENYPRVVLETMTDDEISLQQLVLGEVEVAVMDIASLSFYLSKQVLSSVKIIGNVGFDYEPAFVVQEDKRVLLSILEKGMTQISATDRQILIDKWIVVPEDEKTTVRSFVFKEEDMTLFYVIFAGVVVIISALLLRKREFRSHLGRRFGFKAEKIERLKQEMQVLEEVNDTLVDQVKAVKEKEDQIQAELERLKKDPI